MWMVFEALFQIIWKIFKTEWNGNVLQKMENEWNIFNFTSYTTVIITKTYQQSLKIDF